MSRINQEDLEQLSNNHIRDYLNNNEFDVLPTKVKQYINDANHYYYEKHKRNNRIQILLHNIIINRFKNNQI